ncbi:MAG TPA: RES family NAD+ phosphorylase [Bryobacteraceae bacterium]|nr:RES family NAD+ phosphorylase [Bryobacteraceae bacterium]
MAAWTVCFRYGGCWTGGVVEIDAPAVPVHFLNTVRLVPSRYPSTGILDVVAGPEDLDAIIELEAWTNDRISTEIGILYRLPPEEWVTGKPMSSVIMAAFCHPRAGGARFSGADRGAWYAGRTLSTAHAEVIYHRTQELAEIGVFDTFVQVRAYKADFNAVFQDIRAERREFTPLYDPDSYIASQAFGRTMFESGSNGIVYRSVRASSGECIVCFRPKLVKSVRQGAHFEYRWSGSPEPKVRQLP